MIDRGAIGDSFAYCSPKYSARLCEWAEYADEHLYLLGHATLLVAPIRNERKDYGDEEGDC